MPIVPKKKKGLTPIKKKYWQPFSSGYESTRSPEIINNALAHLAQKGVYITLAQKGYKSGPTVLIGFDKGLMVVEKPLDWPKKASRIRITFRDKSNLLIHCFASLVSSTANTLSVRKPTELFRLQRRKTHRVETPFGSRVSFSYKGLKSRKFIIKNISAGGLLFCVRKQLQLKGAPITDISVNIPLNNTVASPNDEINFQAEIRTGEIVRACQDNNTDFFCYGVSFLSNSGEEESVAKYVRFRELELLRTGVTA